jgi:hypothetical protein
MNDKEILVMADARERHDKHGSRTQSYAFGLPFDPVTNPDGFRAYVTLGRYRRTAPIIETRHNVYGRLCWFTQAQMRVFRATMAELEAGRELHSSIIANLAGVSQGYATKVLQKLCWLRFIDVSAVIRGRYGRIVASITKRVRQSFLHTRVSSIYGGMIKVGPYELVGGEDPDGLVSQLVKLERSGAVTMLPPDYSTWEPDTRLTWD